MTAAHGYVPSPELHNAVMAALADDWSTTSEIIERMQPRHWAKTTVRQTLRAMCAAGELECEQRWLPENWLHGYAWVFRRKRVAT